MPRLLSTRLRLWLVAASSYTIGLLAALPIWAGGAAAMLGEDLRANAETAQIQQSAAVALDARGDFVVAWQSEVAGHGDEIRARRFDGHGAAKGDEIAVNTLTRSHQLAPAIATDAKGNFVVTWQSLIENNFEIRARRFDARGQPQGDEFAVNTTHGDTHGAPSIAMNAGGFVIVWENSFHGSYEIRARRFDAQGVAHGDPVTVNALTASSQRFPAVAMNAAGDYVVAWRSNIKGSFEIRAQRFTAQGLTAGGEIAVNAVSAGDQLAPAVAMAADGSFVVAWENSFEDQLEIRARRFDAQGIAIAKESAAQPATAGNQFTPAIAMNGAGDYLIAWHDTAANTSDIRAQAFSARGNALGGALAVNGSASGTQKSAAIALGAAGNFVVSWHTNTRDDWDVAARRGRISTWVAR